MSKIEIDIPDEVLGKEKEKELKFLRGKVDRLEKKVGDLTFKLQERQELFEACKNLRLYIMDNFQLYEDDDFKNWDL